MTTIFLARHATPDWSRTDIRYDIPPGPPLTEQGEREARQLGRFLREAGVQKLYASPMERTRRTAELAADVAEADHVEASEIGEWQRGENDATVLGRMLPFFERALAESDDEGPLAFVSHGGPIRILLEHLQLEKAQIDFYRKQFDRDNPLPPAGVWQLTRTTPDAAWRFELVFTPQPFRPYEPQTVYV